MKMASTKNFSNVDVVIEVNGKDVKLCVEYWIDCWDDWSYYIVETVNGLPSDMFTDGTIDSIVEAIVDTIENKNTDLACSNLMCNEDY
jgi:hypothetical protein